MAAAASSSGAPATPWWKNKAWMAMGAAVLVAVVLVAVLVPTLSNKQSSSGKAASGAGGLVTDKSGVVVPTADLTNVVNALLVANTPATVPADLADRQAGNVTPTTTTTTTTNTATVTPVSGAEGDKAPASSAGSPLTQLAIRAWPGLTVASGAAGANPSICYPKNGSEVVAASKAESKCTIIMLMNGGNKPYDITQQMNITTTKIFIGNPIDMPKLNATGKTIHRLFEVRAGGRLELRALRLYRAPPEILPTNFKLFAGGTVRVLLGGSISAYGCIFLLQPQTPQSFMRELDSPLSRYRLVGGHVLVLGGNAQFIGCQVFRWQPYGNPILNVVQIGRDFAVLAGNCLCVGVFDAVGTLFLSAVNIGNIFCVLGGTGVLVGGGNINAAVANNQLGAGKNIFVGGGVLITVGYQNIGSFVLLLRSGFATHATGGGVLIHIGHIHVRAWGVCGVFNAGQTHAVGGGIFEKLGGVLITDNLNFVFAGAGGNTFVGGGEAYWLGAPQTRCLLTTSQNGVGMIYFNGGGYVNVIGCPSASANGVRSQHVLGGETFIGGGVVNYINYKRFNVQICNAFFGQGTQIFNGGGGVALINSFSRNKRRATYQTPNSAAIFVGGRRVGAAPGVPGYPPTNRNQWITAKKVVVYSNRTNANKILLPWNRNKRRVQVNMDATPPALFEVPPSLLMVQSALEDDAKQIFAAEDFDMSETTGGGAVSSQSMLKGYHALVNFMKNKQQEPAAGAGATASGDTKVSVPEGAECFLCNVGPYPTSDRVMNGQCETSEECKGATPLEALQVAAKEYAPKQLPLDPTLAQIFGMDHNGRRLPEAAATASPMNLPDSNLVWNELSIYCPTTAETAATTGATAAKCVSDELIKATVQAYLNPLPGVSVAVAPKEVHAAVADVVPDDTKESIMAEPTADQNCMLGTKYDLYISTLDNANVPELQQVFASIQEDPSDFLALLNEAKDITEEGGDKACALSLTPKTTVSFPPVDKMPAFQPRTLGLLGPSVTMGSADSIVPTTEAVKGKDYTLFLQNFPLGSDYEVRLMDFADPVGTVIATVDASEMGKDGVAEAKWTAPADLQTDPDSRYYLKASLKSFPAFFTVSQPFFIRDQATPGRRW